MHYVLVHPLKSLKDAQVRSFATIDEVQRFRTKNLALATYDVTSAKDLREVPMEALLAVFNRGARVPATRFANRDAACEAVFHHLEDSAMAGAVKEAKAKQAATAVKTPVEKVAKAPAAPRTPKLLTRAAGSAAKAVRAGSKTALLVDLLAKGTTLKEIETKLGAVGRPCTDPRGWVAYNVCQLLGYGVAEADGELTLMLPKGLKAPLAHLEKAVVTPKAPKVAPAAPKAAKEAPTVKKTPAKRVDQVKGATAAPVQAVGGPKPGRESKKGK